MSKALSLITRESFFDDSFFQDAWSDFDKAVQQVLDKFDNKGLKVDTGSRLQCHDTYRQIRSRKIDEDLYASQALQISEKDGNFQCVMDVKDFNPNNLQVRVVDDRVVVEGKYEKKSEDGSSMSSKSFYKEFTMPASADIDMVATALSKDGILTVKAPKKSGDVAARPSGGTVQSSHSSSVQESSSSFSSGDAMSSSKQTSSFSSSTSSSSVIKSSSTSSSSFSSTSQFSSGMEGLEDMSKDMKDRLVFTHDTVNLKLPGNK